MKSKLNLDFKRKRLNKNKSNETDEKIKPAKNDKPNKTPKEYSNNSCLA